MFGVGATFRATPATTIYGNITEAYRPTLLNDNWQADSRVVVDPHLKDMTGYVSELGYRGTLGRWLTFDFGGFYIRYNDRLGRLTTQTSTGPTFSTRTSPTAAMSASSRISRPTCSPWPGAAPAGRRSSSSARSRRSAPAI